jgi:hypothetical protein
MNIIQKPKTVSFEDALKNLASRLTGVPAADLPRTQEGVVQYMAENIPSLSDMAESIANEVTARMVAAQIAMESVNGAASEGEADPDQTPDTTAESTGEGSQESSEDTNNDEAQAPKKRSKAKTTE